MSRVACVQCNVAYGNPKHNADYAVAEIQRLAKQGVELIVFPEAFLTGYSARDRQEARGIAISSTDPALSRIDAVAQKENVTVIVGFAGVDADSLYNGAQISIPLKQPQIYKKTHLPILGFDRFAEPGERLDVVETPIGKIGILICFDLRFPEATRTLALQGAEMLVLPTNWPNGAQVSAEHISIARAAENRIYVATCNRVGEEAGFTFFGRSKIIGIDGEVLAEAADGEVTLVADIDLKRARGKRRVVIENEYETDVFEPRQPRLYEEISK